MESFSALLKHRRETRARRNTHDAVSCFLHYVWIKQRGSQLSGPTCEISFPFCILICLKLSQLTAEND